MYCRGASILLVGTHKDRVPDPRDHERISGLLTDRLQANPSWVRVAPFLEGEVSTGRGVLCFFPVDNTRGNRDPVVGQLMRQVEAAVRGAEHMGHKVPFAWLALLDRVEALKRERLVVVPFGRFLRACAEAGMPSGPSAGLEAEAGLALRFFDRLGVLMHHAAVPHLVILRPADFLLPLFTRVICDFRTHAGLVPEHAEAKRRCPADFQAMQTRGVVSARLLAELWAGCEYRADVQQLMVSLGLMVPVLSRGEEPDGGGDGAEEFLVPAILPEERRAAGAPAAAAALTARVVFSTVEAVGRWRRLGYLTMGEIEAEAQVPVAWL